MRWNDRHRLSRSLSLSLPLARHLSVSFTPVTPVGKLTTNSERKDLQRVNLDFNEACLKRPFRSSPFTGTSPVTNGQLLLIAADSVASEDEKSCYAFLPFFHCAPIGSGHSFVSPEYCKPSLSIDVYA